MKLNNLFIFIMLFASVYAANLNSDGHGGSYYTTALGTIRAYPDVSNGWLGSQEQLINLTYTGSSSAKANISFAFSSPIKGGKAYILQNISHTISNAIYNVGNTSQIGWYNTTVYYPDWVDMSASFVRTRIGNYDVYTINNVQFNPGTFYQTKFNYQTEPGTSGKYNIYVHSGSPTQVAQGLATVYLELDPSYNSTGGTTTVYDGNYTVVTFLANGTFNVTGTISNASILIVAGGGAGYGYADGGGGAGGVIYLNSTLNLNGNYNITIGVGGGPCSGISCATATGNGKPSEIRNTTFNYTAIGGGLGGIFQQAASIGGSGGGGGRAGVNTAGAAGTAGQGYAGSNGASDNCGGGGGGANGTPSNCDGTNGAKGGAGFNSSINGTLICYAGGGGGGSRSGTAGVATCGGANGTVGGAAGANASNNLGGGGAGGAGGGGAGSNGGSGIVIIRYLTFVYGNLTVNSTIGGTATGNNSTIATPANISINATASVGYYFFNWTTNCNGTFGNSTNANTYIQVNDVVACYAQANFANATPIVNSIQILNSTNGTYFINGSVLYAWVNVTSPTTSTPTIYYKWYLNNLLNTTGSIIGLNNVKINIDIKIGAVSGQSWKIGAIASNGTYNSTPVNSSAINISDNIPPVLTVFSPGNGSRYYNGTGVVINFSATDNIGVSSLWFYNGTANVTYTTPITLMLPVGNYNFTFYANDTSNNIASSIIFFAVNSFIHAPLPAFDFNITPNPGNSTQVYTLNFNISLTGLATYVRYRNWTDIIQNWLPNANSIACTSAIGCNTALFADVMLTNGTANSSIVTNKTLVYTTEQQNLPGLGETILANYLIDYGALVIGLFVVAIAFIISPLISGALYGVNDRIISTTLVLSGMLYFVAFLIIQPQVIVFGYLVVPCIVLGFLARYWNI